MDVILHLGAHRTANQTFHDYLRRHAGVLASRGVGFWILQSPALFDELAGPGPAGPGAEARLAGVLHRALAREERRGIRRLVVSLPSLPGTSRQNIARADLYPDAGARVARLAQMFGGRVSGAIFCPRSLPRYWTSALAAEVVAGAEVPGPDRIAAIACAPRSWREVIADIAGALTGVPLRVLPFESYCGRPDAFLAQGAGIDAPFDRDRRWLGRAPALPALRRALNQRGASGAVLPFGTGNWVPFTNEEHAFLRERHADDMMWLTAGAGGLAILTEDTLRGRAGQIPPVAACKEGLRDEHEERPMARPG